MFIKRTIALLFMMVLATQMLPVQQIGSVLFGNQVNEELPHSIESGKDAGAKILKTDPFIGVAHAYTNYLSAVYYEYSHYIAKLPLNHSGEIHTPPPNIA